MELRLSVVIPTRDRVSFLSFMLDSLEGQTLSSRDFEIVVVDDGSTDRTPDVCRQLAADQRIRYRRVTAGGIAHAKNFGILGAQGEIILFLDDDDIAAPDLLERHLEMHDCYPEQGAAILGYTSWAPGLAVTPLMKYVTEVGCQLFSYPLDEGVPLAYHHFWGGRTSCKRRFLLDHGIFNPAFTSIIEDIELAYRLAPAGLTVLHTRSAVTAMARGFSFEEFCDRCERRGRALALFATLHPEPEVVEFCGTRDALERWKAMEALFREKVARVAVLEGQPRDKAILRELYELYGWVFDACQLKGIVQADQPTLASGQVEACR